MSNNNTSLPAEFQKELDDLVEKHTLKLPNDNDYQIGFEKGMEAGLEIGATEYATKLHEAQKELKDYSGIIDRMEKEGTEMKRLLHEVFMKHESGLLPDRFVYDKIKLFLYGE
jgi:hypothetical protein